MTAARLFSVSGFVVWGARCRSRGGSVELRRLGRRAHGRRRHHRPGRQRGQRGRRRAHGHGRAFRVPDRPDAGLQRRAADPRRRPRDEPVHAGVERDRRQVLQRVRSARLRVQLLGARSGGRWRRHLDQRSRRRRARRKFPAHADGRPRRLCGRRHLFDHCVNARRSTRSGSPRGWPSGDSDRLHFHAYLQTFEQRPDDARPRPAAASAASCYSFPARLIWPHCRRRPRRSPCRSRRSRPAPPTPTRSRVRSSGCSGRSTPVRRSRTAASSRPARSRSASTTSTSSRR